MRAGVTHQTAKRSITSLGLAVAIVSSARPTRADEPAPPPPAEVPANEPGPAPPTPDLPPPAAPPPATPPPATPPPAAPALSPAVAPPASAPPRLGRRGQLVTTDQLSLSAYVGRRPGSPEGAATVVIRPSVEYFVVDGFALGVQGTLLYEESYGVRASRRGVELLSTLAVGLGDSAAILARASVGLAHVARAGSDDSIVPTASLFVPFVLRPSQGFFVGLGPTGTFHARNLLTSSGTRAFAEAGVRSIVGAYLDASDHRPAPLAFGRARDLAITSESDVSAVYQSLYGGRVLRTSASLSPGVDYFVADHVSIGGAIAVSYLHSDLPISTADSVSRRFLSLGAGPRVGLALPLGEAFTFYPRLSGGAGVQYQWDDGDVLHVRAYASIYAPLLAHRGHALLGFGPFFTPELSYSRFVYSAGASAIVGGWL